jgi:hypothetical protein
LFLVVLLVSLACSVFGGTFKTALADDPIVSVTNVTLQQSFVQSGFTLPVTVTIHNSGSVSEVANVQLFANSTSIFNGTISLNSLTSGVLGCSVNTSSLPIANYTITVSVVPSDEPNATPSTMSAGPVGVTYIGDLNGGFTINFNDMTLFVSDYFNYFANGVYNPAIDYEHDGIINFNDVSLFIGYYEAYYASMQPTQTSASANYTPPTPTGTSITGTNLEPLSAFMNSNDVPNMPNGGNYASYDPSVTYNGNPSIQDIGNNPSNPEGEVDGAWIHVSPGDHIEISVWVETGASTSTDLQSGATFGFDFLGDSNLGEGIVGSSSTQQAGQPTAEELACGSPSAYGYTINGDNGLTQVAGLICKVPFGVSTWTEIQWDFIVPSTHYTSQWINPSGSAPGDVSSITGTQINEMVCWFMVNSNVNNANVWYADPTLYNLGQTSLP